MNPQKPYVPQRRIAFAITVLGAVALLVYFKDTPGSGPDAPIFWVSVAMNAGIVVLATILYSKVGAMPPRTQKAMRGYLVGTIIFLAIDLAGYFIEGGSVLGSASEGVADFLISGRVGLLSAIGCYFFLTGKALYPSEPDPKDW